MFKDTAATQIHPPQEAGFDHLGQGPIDGRAADLALAYRAGQVGNQVVGIEVFVLPEDLLDNQAPLPRVAHPLAL
jgi:hypothetical protein